jgi:polysaccharide biosynthesis/export protein
MMSMLLAVALVALADAASVPATAPAPAAAPPAATASTPVVSDEYRVGAGDVLDITVIGDTDLSRPAAIVQTNGTVTLPLIGEVGVATLTVSEIKTKLTRLVERYLVRPQIEVRVKDFQSQFVTVLGEVNSPGKKPLRGQTRLLDVLTDAGSFTTNGSGEVEISRIDGTFSGGEKTLRVRLGKSAPTAQDIISLQIPLRHGDLIRALPKYYVVVDGEVAHPGRYLLEPDLTVTGLLSIAGGLTRWAKTDVKILRRDPSAKDGVKVIRVDYKDVRKGKELDVPLEANDVIQVGRRLF